MTVPAPIGSIAHYTLLERLDPSGPGELYRARDTHRGRTVVVRWLPSELTPDEAARQMLIQMARGTTVLSHPNVTALFDLGEHQQRVYLVFEFLTGRSLRAEMGGRPMNVRRAVEIAIQVADAVAEAHAAGFLHGGLSPETITVTEKGHAKIPAFELAVRGGFDVAGAAGAGKGTFVRLADYDSPEEARGGPPDDRSDVYSIGAILYEMLTTRRPSHRGASAPSATNAKVPKELDDVTLKATAPNPASRYQGVAVLAAELRGLVPVFDARGVGDDDELAASSGGAGTVAVIAGAALLALGAIVWWIMRS